MSNVDKTRERRSGGRRGRAGRGSAPISQLSWQNLHNPYAPMELATREQIEAIHNTSLKILSELGIRVMSARVMDIFEAAGAKVDRGEDTIRIDAEVIDEALRTVPETFTLTGRNPAKKLTIGGRNVAFGLVAGPPNVHDCITGRRSGNLADYENFIRLAHHFNAINIIGNQVTAPMELPANNRHLDTYRANLRLSDLSFHCTAIGKGRAMDGINMMAIARGISPEEMETDPGIITIISVNSPRLLDGEMAEGLIAMALHGQPVSVTPFTLMGAMTPVSLPAALTQQNAEALFGIALTQLVSPGAPVMYGAFTSNANASNAVDLQAAYETSMATWGAVMGGANMVYHAAGWLEGGLTASYEKLILDVEIIQNMMELLKPIDFSEGELGFDAIADVPTGGHFFGTSHTLERYETAFYKPILSDWTGHGAWEAAGAKDALTRATELWQRALGEYREPVLDPAIAEELETYIAHRKEEIGAGEP